jgi:FkbM family methyltransferase
MGLKELVLGLSVAQRLKSKLSPPPHMRLRHQIAKTFPPNRAVFFVQVGSNDGRDGDPLYEFASSRPNWRGVLIKPVRFLFEQLRANYNNEQRFSFENIAISPERGTRPFFYISDKASERLPDLPYWIDQLGSFDRNHVVKHCLNAEEFIVEEQIQCAPLSDILERNRVDNIDILHVDTEGHDAVVLDLFDLKRHRPSLIIYEHVHLSEPEKTRHHDRLRDAGYSLTMAGSDTIATHDRPPSLSAPRKSLPRTAQERE